MRFVVALFLFLINGMLIIGFLNVKGVIVQLYQRIYQLLVLIVFQFGVAGGILF